MWHSFLTPMQLQFPVQSRKPHVLHSHQKIKTTSRSVSPSTISFSWAPSNYLFKRDTKGRIITIPKYCLVLELASGPAFLLPPYFHLSYLLYTSISTSLSHHLSFSFPAFHIRVLQMCVCGLGNICFYSKPPVQFDSNQPPSVMFAWHAWWKIENT